MGLEPTTFSLATRRSTTELCPPVLLVLKLVPFLKFARNSYRICLEFVLLIITYIKNNNSELTNKKVSDILNIIKQKIIKQLIKDNNFKYKTYKKRIID